MSTLHANTVETSSGGPVTLTKQQAAKVYFNVDQTVGSILVGSFNVSGATDNSTGDFTVNFSSNFSSANDTAAPLGSRNYTLQIHDTLITTSSIELYSRNVTPAVGDQTHNTGTVFGDLA
jgi:hypothetical protein